MDSDLVLAPAGPSLVQDQPDQEGFFFEVFGQRIPFLCLQRENAVKLLLTAVLVLVLRVARWLARAARPLLQQESRVKTYGSGRRAIHLAFAFAFLLLLGLLSIWFDEPARLATGVGPVTAGPAFSLQKAITSGTGCFAILRRDTLSVWGRDLEPHVSWRITDNWLTVRWLTACTACGPPSTRCRGRS